VTALSGRKTPDSKMASMEFMIPSGAIIPARPGAGSPGPSVHHVGRRDRLGRRLQLGEQFLEVGARPERVQVGVGAQNLAWALLNTPAFLFDPWRREKQHEAG
jgi:hypothetical protein